MVGGAAFDYLFEAAFLKIWQALPGKILGGDSRNCLPVSQNSYLCGDGKMLKQESGFCLSFKPLVGSLTRVSVRFFLFLLITANGFTLE